MVIVDCRFCGATYEEYGPVEDRKMCNQCATEVLEELLAEHPEEDPR